MLNIILVIAVANVISPRGFPNRHQRAEAAEQQGADGDGAAVGVLGQELQRRRAHRRADAVAHANGGFVDAAVFALGVARVHRVKQRRVINQADGRAEKDLRQQQHGEIGNNENRREGNDERCKCRHEPAKTVVPVRPGPQRDERAEPHKAPQRTRKSGEHGREMEVCRQGGQQWNESVDGEVGERIRQPRHAQKRSGLGWRRAVRVGRGRGRGLVAVSASGVRVSLQPENQG